MVRRGFIIVLIFSTISHAKIPQEAYVLTSAIVGVPLMITGFVIAGTATEQYCDSNSTYSQSGIIEQYPCNTTGACSVWRTIGFGLKVCKKHEVVNTTCTDWGCLNPKNISQYQAYLTRTKQPLLNQMLVVGSIGAALFMASIIGTIGICRRLTTR